MFLAMKQREGASARFTMEKQASACLTKRVDTFVLEGLTIIIDDQAADLPPIIGMNERDYSRIRIALPDGGYYTFFLFPRPMIPTAIPALAGSSAIHRSKRPSSPVFGGSAVHPAKISVSE